MEASGEGAQAGVAAAALETEVDVAAAAAAAAEEVVVEAEEASRTGHCLHRHRRMLSRGLSKGPAQVRPLHDGTKAWIGNLVAFSSSFDLPTSSAFMKDAGTQGEPAAEVGGEFRSTNER